MPQGQAREQIETLVAEIRTQLDARLLAQSEEINRLRELLNANELSDAEAEERIAALEKGFERMREEVKEITKELMKMNLIVSSFSPKLDRFFDNLWKVVFFLLAIIGALVGIKIM